MAGRRLSKHWADVLICCQVMRWRVVSRLVPREDIPRPPPSLHHPASSHPPPYTLRLQTHQLEMIPREARTQPPPASQPHTVRVSQILSAHVFYTNGQFCVLQIIYSVSCISKVSIMCPKYFRIPLKYPCFVKIDGAQKIISNAWKMSPRLKIFPVFRNIPQI